MWVKERKMRGLADLQLCNGWFYFLLFFSGGHSTIILQVILQARYSDTGSATGYELFRKINNFKTKAQKEFDLGGMVEDKNV